MGNTILRVARPLTTIAADANAPRFEAVAADPDVLFEMPVEDRLPAAMRLLGIDFSRLSDDVGHA